MNNVSFISAIVKMQVACAALAGRVKDDRGLSAIVSALLLCVACAAFITTITTEGNAFITAAFQKVTQGVNG